MSKNYTILDQKEIKNDKNEEENEEENEEDEFIGKDEISLHD